MRKKFISLVSFRQGFYFTLIYSINRNIAAGSELITVVMFVVAQRQILKNFTLEVKESL
jgi:hypothetical protein